MRKTQDVSACVRESDLERERERERDIPDRIHLSSEGFEGEEKAKHELLVLLLAQRRVRSQPHMVMQTHPIPVEYVHAPHARCAH